MQLEHEGHKCTSISGELEMSARDRVVNEFREGKTRILIATDVLSRGFDVQQVSPSHGQNHFVLARTSDSPPYTLQDTS